MDQLRHIWQLCDVTRDGALDLAEFTAAMHLVVLRRNNIPIPPVLPGCLLPNYLLKTLGLPEKETTEVDLLQLESDDNQSSAAQKASATNKNDYQRIVSSTYDEIRSTSSGKSKINKSSTLPKNHYSQRQRVSDEGDDCDEQKPLNILNTNKVLVSKNVI